MRLRKNEEVVRELQDNMKRNNIRIIGIPEGEEEDQGRENLFEEVMMENFPNLMRENVTKIQETQRSQSKRNPKRHTSTHIKLKWQIPRQREDLKGSKGETGNNI